MTIELDDDIHALYEIWVRDRYTSSIRDDQYCRRPFQFAELAAHAFRDQKRLRADDERVACAYHAAELIAALEIDGEELEFLCENDDGPWASCSDGVDDIGASCGDACIDALQNVGEYALTCGYISLPKPAADIVEESIEKALKCRCANRCCSSHAGRQLVFVYDSCYTNHMVACKRGPTLDAGNEVADIVASAPSE
jgi:hypothetical protein